MLSAFKRGNGANFEPCDRLTWRLPWRLTWRLTAAFGDSHRHCLQARCVPDINSAMDRQETDSHALFLLHWQRDAGADCAVGESPVDWLMRGPVTPGQSFRSAAGGQSAVAGASTDRTVASHARQPASARDDPRDAARRPALPSRSPALPAGAQPIVPRRPQTPLATREAENEGRAAAAKAATLDDLETALKSFDGCTLRATATNLCFYRGSPDARVMIIGEAPGRDEDLTGKPFVGRAGQLLDKMLASIGLNETNVHITNVVYWRPPGNRTPTPQETMSCRPFLERQIELVDPDLVVALGGSAAKELFQLSEGIMKLRGKWRTAMLGGRERQAVATLHPAYLLRTPAAKQLVWRDLLALKQRIQNDS